MMKYYKTQDGAVYGYDEADQGELISLAVNNGWEDITGSWPHPPEPSCAVKLQIADLEAQQTPRRMREAALGIDNGWLAALDAEIAQLRAQL